VPQLLVELGEDPAARRAPQTRRERVAKAFRLPHPRLPRELDEVINKALFTQDTSSMVIVKDIEVYSMCEHHMLPFFGRCHIGYIPDGKVFGVSKLARIVDMYARRLQLQERLTEQISKVVMEEIGAKGVGVMIEARHLCMMMRGVEKQNSTMVTSSVLGVFREHLATREEFLTSSASRLNAHDLVGMPDSPYVRRCAISHEADGASRSSTSRSRSSATSTASRRSTGGEGAEPRLRRRHGADGFHAHPRLPRDLRGAASASCRAGAGARARRAPRRLAMAACEKSVQWSTRRSSAPRRRRHDAVSRASGGQANAAFAGARARGAGAAKPWLQGERSTPRTVAGRCAWRFGQYYNALEVPAAQYPRSSAYSKRAEALPEFASTPLD
jgi:GTP cyclohydrolase I